MVYKSYFNKAITKNYHLLSFGILSKNSINLYLKIILKYSTFI